MKPLDLGECGLLEPVDLDLVAGGLEAADRGAGRRGRRRREVDPQPEEALGGPVAGLEQQRPRGLVAGGDQLAHERHAALAGAGLRQPAQARPQPAPAGAGVHHYDGVAVGEQDRVGGEAAPGGRDHPRVALEIDARPVQPHVVEGVVGPPEVLDVAGVDHLEDLRRVDPGGRAQPLGQRRHGGHSADPTRDGARHR